MRGKGATLLLAAAGLSLSLFETWAASLPPEEAGSLEFCRFSRALDCVRSVQLHGHDLAIGPLPLLPALAACFFAIAALAGLAATAADGSGPLGWARILGVPAAGLSLFQLLDHALTAKCTSVDAILLGAVAVAVAAGGLRERPSLPALRASLGGAAAAIALGVAFGGCMGAAGAARLLRAEIAKEEAARPAAVLWPDFEESMPRQGAAFLGDPLAPREVLLFADPSAEPGRAVLSEALRLAPEFGGRVRIVVYGPGPLLLQAAAEGRVEETLRALAEGRPPPAFSADVAALAARIERHRAALGIGFAPTLVWRGGRETGSFDLRSLLDRASR